MGTQEALMRKALAWVVLAAAGCASARPQAAREAVEPAVSAPALVTEAASFGPSPAPPAPVAELAGSVEPAPPPAPPKPKSGQLRGGLHNPLPGGVVAGYQADTGLDIAGVRLPVHSIAAGTLDYSEPGHTLWTGPKDTANCVRVKLDEPIAYKGRLITHVYYAHLASLETLQAEGATQRKHVEAGELLGISGVARFSPHLHIGLLLDGEVEQYWGTFLLADEIRAVLGGYKNGDRF
jgi:hypothetical protein